jgi:ABC-type transporter Mla MlaB component
MYSGEAQGKPFEARPMNAKELLHVRFIIPPKAIVFTNFVNLRVLDGPPSAQSPRNQPVAVGTCIAQQKSGTCESMLRIQELDSGDLVTFVLSGRIQKEDLEELKSLIEKHHNSVILDLKEVKLVDRDAVEFLAGFETSLCKITNCAPYIREWIRREREQQ